LQENENIAKIIIRDILVIVIFIGKCSYKMFLFHPASCLKRKAGIHRLLTFNILLS
jgi:hypothetical protein